MGLDRAFLSLLTIPASLHRYQAQDAFGNTGFAAPEAIKGYFDTQTATLGDTDGHDRANGRTVLRGTGITDALGIKVGDKITLAGPRVFFVVEAQTALDEDGTDLFQNITIESTERG